MTSKKQQKENRLVVGDATWADAIPEWLLEEIKYERMIYGLAGIVNPDAPKIGFAEIAAYLMTASMRGPLSHEHTKIYLYCCARVFERKGKEMTDDMKEVLKLGLTKGEEYFYKELVDNIYRARGGKIKNPLIEVMKALKKKCDKKEAKQFDHTEEDESGKVQAALFEGAEE